MTLPGIVNRPRGAGTAHDRGVTIALEPSMNQNSQLVSSGIWQWLQRGGMERFEFLRDGDRRIFRGTILTFADRDSAEARYEIICDQEFRTRRAEVSLRTATGERTLQISVENGRWHTNGRESAAVQGAIDIDLGWSPSTNALPIRRLNLAVGGSSGEFIAAWVRFPELTLEPLPQEYLRRSECVYRYSSRGGDFTAELQVDDEGIVGLPGILAAGENGNVVNPRIGRRPDQAVPARPGPCSSS